METCLGAWERASAHFEAALAADLAALGAGTDPVTIEEARRLFARTLDARGGLRIQTIHSFAQSLLASFPVEAGVAPGFTTLDDRSGIELRARVLAETLERVCVETVESGDMTKDLAILISKDQPWLNTQAFLAKIDENLQKAMG